MGEYVYALRSPKLNRVVTIRTEEGGIFTTLAASYSFLYKPNYYDRERDNWVRPFLARMRKIWKQHEQKTGEPMPGYWVWTNVDHSSKIEAGQHVYRWPDHFKGMPYAWGDSYEGMVKVGTIIQVLE